MTTQADWIRTRIGAPVRELADAFEPYAPQVRAIHENLGAGGRAATWVMGKTLGASLLKDLAGELPAAHREIEAWAAVSDLDPTQVMILNCSYTLSAWGCTSVVSLAAGEPIHFRTLDWEMDALRGKTLVHEYERTDGEPGLSTVGFPGLVGVLTALRPGRFSVSVNHAPFGRSATLDGGGWDPLFAVRAAAEESLDYDGFVAAIREPALRGACFVTVAGARGQAAVLERTARATHVISPEAGVVAVANLFDPEGPFASENRHQRDDDVLQKTSSRRQRLARGLASKADSAGAALSILQNEPIHNPLTLHRVAMLPAGHELVVEQT